MGIKHTHCKRGHALTSDNRTKKGRCKTCTKVIAAAYAIEYKKAHPTYFRDYNLKKMYGLTRPEYDSMLKMQDNKCAICQRLMSDACVDHDHQTEQVRELLCYACNAGIGNLHDDILVLERALAYLRKHKEQ